MQVNKDYTLQQDADGKARLTQEGMWAAEDFMNCVSPNECKHPLDLNGGFWPAVWEGLPLEDAPTEHYFPLRFMGDNWAVYITATGNATYLHVYDGSMGEGWYKAKED